MAGVLDVEPQHVGGDVVRVEARVHGAHVRLVHVVPARLVVRQREALRDQAIWLSSSSHTHTHIRVVRENGESLTTHFCSSPLPSSLIHSSVT